MALHPATPAEASDTRPVLPMHLSQFPDPQLYSECQEMVGIMSTGSRALDTTTYYYAAKLGKSYQLWKAYLGDCYFHAVMASVSPDLNRTMTAIEAPTEHGSVRVVPDIVLLVAHAFTVALNHKTGELLSMLSVALDAYLNLDTELVPYIDDIRILLKPFDLLLKSTEQEGPYKAHQLNSWRKACWKLVSDYSVPVKAIRELIQEPDAPIVLPDPGKVPVLLNHVDGSTGVDLAPYMPEWFAPRRPIVTTAKDQIHDTLRLHSKPYADGMMLWWRIHNDGRHTETYMHTAARVLDAVGRMFAFIFTPAQMTRLNTLVPMDIVVSGAVDFVVACNANPPSLSSAQLRVSFLSAGIAAITVEGQLEATIHSVCEKAGLLDIEKLLFATMQVHEEMLTHAYPPLNANRTKH